MNMVRKLPVLAAALTAATALGAGGMVLSAGAPAYASVRSAAPAKATTAMTAAGVTTALPKSCTEDGAVVCIYADDGFSFGPGIFQHTNANWGTDLGSSSGACRAGSTAASDNEGGWNDCATSIANNTSSDFTFYVNDNCANGGGPTLTLVNKTAISNLNTSEFAGFNDALSSDSVSSSPVGC
jgi:hypothetical protein